MYFYALWRIISTFVFFDKDSTFVYNFSLIHILSYLPSWLHYTNFFVQLELQGRCVYHSGSFFV